MAASDLIKVRRVIVQTVGGQSVSTNGVEELLPLGTVLSTTTGTTTQAGAMRQAANVPAAAVPFADLTAAANAYNALRTALINAGLMSAT